MSRRAKWGTFAIVLAFVIAGIAGGYYGLRHAPPHIKVKLAGADATVPVVRGDDGELAFLVSAGDRTERLSPEAFAQRVYYEQAARPWWQRLMNITSISGVIWVGLGLLGQILFSGRMIVQWLASERSRQSVVPAAFWWLALGGASMLLVYFAWRKDIIGILGQSIGWLIYVRNLYFIHIVPRQQAPDDA
jgi:lipid-A-disaccharide synthase-like uncharacterized protein